MASNCWAMSATGMTSNDPGTWTHQVLCPSMEGSSGGRCSRAGASRRSRSRCRWTTSSGVTSSTAGSTSAPASRVGKEYTPESSVQNSSAVCTPAAEGKVWPAAAQEQFDTWGA
ncbi:hypothetical protein GCM10023108_33260 [Saccharopolyspora hordei]